MNTFTQINTGDTIKSFDFPNHDDCYMIGTVTKIDGEIIICKTLEIVFQGKHKPITEMNDEFRTLELGLGMFDGMEGERDRIQVI